MGEGAEDVPGLGGPAGGQGQALEADHGVAAPVGEPVIAGDHGADLLAGGMRAGGILDSTRGYDQELIGGQDELVVKRSAVAGCRPGRAGRSGLAAVVGKNPAVRGGNGAVDRNARSGKVRGLDQPRPAPRSARMTSSKLIASSVSHGSTDAMSVTGLAAVSSTWKNPGLHWSPVDS